MDENFALPLIPLPFFFLSLRRTADTERNIYRRRAETTQLPCLQVTGVRDGQMGQFDPESA